jgi:hypothetical protein
MAEYRCPLCKQTVSQQLYEQITGVWKEKEARLAALREQEKKLLARSQAMKAAFVTKERKLRDTARRNEQLRLARQKTEFEAKLRKQGLALQRERAAVEREYKAALAKETNRVMGEARARQRTLEADYRSKIREASAAAARTAKEKLRTQQDRIERRERVLRDKNSKLVLQFRTFQNRHAAEDAKREAKIRSLEEQVSKNQTAQKLGLLEEGVLLEELRRQFPGDEFVHTGKGGDIVHGIRDRGAVIGTIVYELKKVTSFSRAHVQQALEAKQLREADYALLVTNAKKTKESTGFFLSRGVIVVYPAATVVLVTILRGNLVALAGLRLTTEQRKQAVQAVLEYVQKPAFRNSIEGIMQSSMELYDTMVKEAEWHKRNWEYRYRGYRTIWDSAKGIGVGTLAFANDEHKKREFPVPETEQPALPMTLDK